MREITNNREMAAIKLEGKGFVLNERPESRKLHHVSCDAIHAMVATAHPKYYSEDRAATKEWLDRRFGDGWNNCGLCRGLDH